MTSGLLYQKHLVKSHFWVIFGTSILNDSYNRLEYVFEQIISKAAIKIYLPHVYFAIKINKNMEFYLIWEDLVHFSTANLNWRQYQEGACKIQKEIHAFVIC